MESKATPHRPEKEPQRKQKCDNTIGATTSTAPRTSDSKRPNELEHGALKPKRPRSDPIPAVDPVATLTPGTIKYSDAGMDSVGRVDDPTLLYRPDHQAPALTATTSLERRFSFDRHSPLSLEELRNIQERTEASWKEAADTRARQGRAIVASFKALNEVMQRELALMHDDMMYDDDEVADKMVPVADPLPYWLHPSVTSTLPEAAPIANERGHLTDRELRERHFIDRERSMIAREMILITREQRLIDRERMLVDRERATFEADLQRDPHGNRGV